MTSPRRSTTTIAPTDCWYAVATADEVDRDPLGLRALGRPVLLYRTQDGAAVALEDRCAHRAFPLSEGSLVGDEIQCGLCGFRYAATGQCVAVPTQARVPFGASVTSYPVHESDGLVWVWFGEPGRARLHRVPELPWLVDEGWTSVGGESEVDAGFLLLHESFADVTQVPFVAPEIAPTVLGTEPPELDVVVTERTVTLRREFPAAPLPEWQSAMLGAGDAPYVTEQLGLFVSPAAWVDHWDVTSADGATARLRFSQLVTPVEAGLSRVIWRVSRDFAVDATEAAVAVADLFDDYYERVFDAMETSQWVLDLDGPGPEVNVSADVAALKVREIVQSMVAEQGSIPGVVTTRRARV